MQELQNSDIFQTQNLIRDVENYNDCCSVLAIFKLILYFCRVNSLHREAGRFDVCRVYESFGELWVRPFPEMRAAVSIACVAPMIFSGGHVAQRC
jgi:hypothetical protein